MRKNKIALFANKSAGREVANFLRRRDTDWIGALFLCGESPSLDNEIIDNSEVSKERVFIVGKTLQPNLFEWFKSQEFDFIVSVYWPWLFTQDLLTAVFDSVNFHPSLLPLNRGWYPHVFNILNGSPAGVSLHRITQKMDSGPVWAQRRVDVHDSDTAKSLYGRLEKEIISLFVDCWDSIVSGSIVPVPQDEKIATENGKRDLVDLDRLDPEEKVKIGELIRFLRARSFGEKGFSHFEKDGRKTFFSLSCYEEEGH